MCEIALKCDDVKSSLPYMRPQTQLSHFQTEKYHSL